jgi:hypothetical protein
MNLGSHAFQDVPGYCRIAQQTLAADAVKRFGELQVRFVTVPTQAAIAHTPVERNAR